MSLFKELKRRNVFRVAIAYVVVAWLVLQVADVMIDNIGAPEWLFKFIVLLLGIGFPVAMVFAWAFEMTPEGIKRESEVDRSQSITRNTGRRLDFVIIAVLVVALGYFVSDKYQGSGDLGSGDLGSESNLREGVPNVDVGPGDLTLTPNIPAEPSIAVLPFTDMSPQGDQAYFSDGISEELLNLLVRVDGLKVASRTSSFAFKDSQQGIAQIAAELRVDHVLEGSVRKADNQVRITAQLIDAATDRHLWSATYDRELDDIFAIQDEIANSIVTALQTELGLLQEAGVIEVEADTQDLDAYELYLKGRGLFIARDDLPESMRLLEQAVAIDPEFARAWESLAAVYSVAPSWGFRDREYNQLANQAAERALAMNEQLSTPWAVLGSSAAEGDHDYVRGLQHLDRALANDPKNTTALLWRSIALASVGFVDLAIEATEACLELDPLYENCRRHLAKYQLMAGNPDLALQLFQVGTERGFSGSNRAFLGELMRRGNRLAAALALWRAVADRSFPAQYVLDAHEFPDRDHSEGLARYRAWSENANFSTNNMEDILALGGYEFVDQDAFNFSWLWEPQGARFRQSEYFKPLVREKGIYAYWREVGFPPFCWPQGEDDFECELP